MSAKSINIAVISILLFLSLAMLANSMTKPLGRDEQMYCTGGALMAKGMMIYRDFSYPSQMPYHPLLYAGLFKTLNTTHYLLTGRIVSALCDVAVLVCIVGIYRRIFKSFPVAGMLLGLAGSILYVFNPSVDYANGYAWNHDVVILCVALSFWLFVSTDFGNRARYWRVAVIGGLLTFATWMRVTGVLVELLFLVMLLVQPAQSARQRVKTILPFLIAAAGVSVWPVWVIAQAPRAFFLNIVRIPALYGEWLKRIGMVHSKFNLTLNSITTPGYLVLIAVAVYLCIVVMHLNKKKFSHRGHRGSSTDLSGVAKAKTEAKKAETNYKQCKSVLIRVFFIDGKNLLLAALLPVVFFIIAFIPPTMWKQYLAMPVPFLVIWLAYPLLYLRELASKDSQNKHFKIAAVLVALCVVVAVVSQPIVLSRTLMLAAPEGWTPVQLHRISQDIAQRTKEPKLALTLAPLFALEGGCDIYTELSAGSIIYRIADLMSPDDRAITHTVGPKTLGELVEKSPPAVVIVGVEMEFLEEHLLKTAVKPDWERKVYENGVTSYFRP
jgi:hypothetical protein